MADGAMPESVARIATAQAGKYLVQLCKHFAHKIPAEYADDRGRIQFEAGVCEADATEADVLILRVVSADREKLPVLEDVVERHLRRFAFREELALSWSRVG